ncbi:MAG: hypothetical protein ABEK36_00615 [Candidatus Aenigmatarchaeota archaeon]
MSEEKKLIPKIKKSISSYLSEERGEISKHKMIALGSFLATLTFLDLMPEVSASHTNSFGMSWSSGTISAQHSHHVSSVI